MAGLTLDLGSTYSAPLTSDIHSCPTHTHTQCRACCSSRSDVTEVKISPLCLCMWFIFNKYADNKKKIFSILWTIPAMLSIVLFFLSSKQQNHSIHPDGYIAIPQKQPRSIAFPAPLILCFMYLHIQGKRAALFLLCCKVTGVSQKWQPRLYCLQWVPNISFKMLLFWK